MNKTPSSNVGLVQAVYTAFGRRDVTAIIAYLSPDVEWTEPANPFNPAAGTRRGHAGFLEWAQAGNAAEDILAFQIDRMVADGDTVVVLGRLECRAKSTGKIYSSAFAHVVVVTNGLITRFEEFFDTFAAAEAFRPDGPQPGAT